MKSPCASVVEAYAPTATSLGLATGLSFSPQVQVPAVPAVPTAGLLQALAPERGPARGPAPRGVPKQQLEAMAKRLAMEAKVSVATTPANKKGRAQIRPYPAAPAALASPSGPTSAVATPSPPSVSGSLSHATTPSWRSRPSQATPSAASQGTSEMACKPAMMAESVRPRLSPLLEARWTVVEQRYRGVPQSELDRLDRIDPEVDEANAMLVESFLNVKRSLGAEAPSDSHREPSRSSASRLPAPPHGSDSGLQNAGYQVLCSLPPAPPLRDPLESAYSCSTGADRSGF